METTPERRLRKLLDLASKAGGVEHIAEKAGVSAASLKQIAAGTLLPPKADGTRSKRALGNDAVAKIEEAFNLGRGWFDHPGDYVQGSFATATMIAGDVMDLDMALTTLRKAIAESDKSTRLALEPLFSSLVRDVEMSANSSQLIVKLLSKDGKAPTIPSTVAGDIHGVVLPTGGFVSDGADNSIPKKRGIP